MVVGDFNGDSLLDFATVNTNSNNVSVQLNNGAGGLYGQLLCSRHGAGFGSGGRFQPGWQARSGGGKQRQWQCERAVERWDGGPLAQPRNYAAGTSPAAVAVGDFNRDGKPDLAVANSDSGNVSVLLNGGTGTFGAAANYAAGTAPGFGCGWGISTGMASLTWRWPTAAIIMSACC